MRACRCLGVLARVQAAFSDRVRGWARLGSHRPDRVGVFVVCESCGKIWDLEFRFNPKATAARRQLLAAS